MTSFLVMIMWKVQNLKISPCISDESLIVINIGIAVVYSICRPCSGYVPWLSASCTKILDEV